MRENEEIWHFRRRNASLAPWSCKSSKISSCESTFLLMNKTKRTLCHMDAYETPHPKQMIGKKKKKTQPKWKDNHLDSKIFLLDSSSASRTFLWKKCPCHSRSILSKNYLKSCLKFSFFISDGRHISETSSCIWMVQYEP